MLVPERTSVDLRRRNDYNNELYQLKVDVGMLNPVKNYWADVSSVNPSSEQTKWTLGKIDKTYSGECVCVIKWDWSELANEWVSEEVSEEVAGVFLDGLADWLIHQ